jgi:hypothetical protein
MEKTKDAAVVPVEMGWTDVGSWAALWDVTEKDEDGNALIGDGQRRRQELHIRGESRLVTAIGLENIVLDRDGRRRAGGVARAGPGSEAGHRQLTAAGRGAPVPPAGLSPLGHL